MPYYRPKNLCYHLNDYVTRKGLDIESILNIYASHNILCSSSSPSLLSVILRDQNIILRLLSSHVGDSDIKEDYKVGRGEESVEPVDME